MDEHTPKTSDRRAGLTIPWRALAGDGQIPLLLIRHGRTAANASGRLAGRLDEPLDALGRAQATALAQRLSGLPRAGLYTSPLLRARQTAAALGDAEVIPGLSELDHGELEGLSGRELRRRYPALLRAWSRDPSDVPIPGGETLRQCRDRAAAALAALAARHRPGPPALIVGHKLALGAVLLTARGQPLSAILELRWENAEAILLGWPPSEPTSDPPQSRDRAGRRGPRTTGS